MVAGGATALGRELVREFLAALREEPEFAAEVRALLLPEQPPSPWLSTAEAADHLRVSERTVQRLAGRGRVRSSTIGRRRLYHRDDLDALAQPPSEWFLGPDLTWDLTWTFPAATSDNAATRKPSAHTVSGEWARLGSNQRPPACEAGALPLSYAPRGKKG
jgi:excisionase family DNA binding protein